MTQDIALWNSSPTKGRCPFSSEFLIRQDRGQSIWLLGVLGPSADLSSQLSPILFLTVPSQMPPCLVSLSSFSPESETFHFSLPLSLCAFFPETTFPTEPWLKIICIIFTARTWTEHSAFAIPEKRGIKMSMIVCAFECAALSSGSSSQLFWLHFLYSLYYLVSVFTTVYFPLCWQGKTTQRMLLKLYLGSSTSVEQTGK